MGCAAPVGWDCVGVDQSPHARAVFAHWHPQRAVHGWNLAGVTAAALRGFDGWWLSPPCQPFTVKGAQRDLDDPRSAALRRLLDLLPDLRPWAVAVENVPPFLGSRAHAALIQALDGYHVWQGVLCPTDLGIPAARRRAFVVACRDPLVEPPGTQRAPGSLQDYLDPDPDPALWLTPDVVARHRAVLPVHPDRAECFASSYGRSVLRSGSYLPTPTGPRRFSPAEISRLYGLPTDWPVPRAVAWRLVGNSVSVDCVRHVLSRLPSQVLGQELPRLV
jgi:DNA (cytosine-5)-methyltransferase 1/tRNA (cytosine38-C5)-methyltransferase